MSKQGVHIMKSICYSGLLIILSTSLFAQQIEHITPKLISLGRVQQGSIVKDEIRFVNKMEIPITVRGVKSTCGCTATEIKKREYNPGDTARIAFTLNTQGFQGRIRKTLTISFQEKAIKDERIVVEAEIYSELSVNPRYIHIKEAHSNPDTVITAFFTIQNESEEPVNCSKIYAISDMIQIFPASAVIPPGKENLIKVELKPLRSGRHSFYVIILTDNKKKPRMNVPIFVNIEN